MTADNVAWCWHCGVWGLNPLGPPTLKRALTDMWIRTETTMWTCYRYSAVCGWQFNNWIIVFFLFMVRWWYAILFFSVSVCACVCTNKASVCVCVYFSVLVPRSHMTPPSPPPCFGLFLNIPCSEVQRVVYRDFPFMRVPLSLCLACVVSLSPSVSRSLFLYLSLHISLVIEFGF